MPRELTGHKVNACNEALKVEAADGKGAGGASVDYRVTGHVDPSTGHPECFTLRFQEGPPATDGVNGITHEALLTILIDRLEGFQSGPYACQENQGALDAVRIARGILQARTKARIARGVEGTHEV